MDDVRILVEYEDGTGKKRALDVHTRVAVYAVKVPGKEGGVSIAAGIHGHDWDVARAIHTIVKCAVTKGLGTYLTELQMHDALETGAVGASTFRGGDGGSADFGEIFNAMLGNDDDERRPEPGRCWEMLDELGLYLVENWGPTLHQETGGAEKENAAEWAIRLLKRLELPPPLGGTGE